MLQATVGLVRCDDYEQGRVDEAVGEALDLVGGLGQHVRAGDRVLLKANLLAPTEPEKAVTTHPAVVRAMIRQVRAAGAVPLVGDCSAFERRPSRRLFGVVCRKTGMTEVCEEEGVELIHLSAEEVEVENPDGLAFKRFTLSRAARETDVLINLPKLKTHGLTLFTGGVKNLFGCLPGMLKGHMHLRAQRVEHFSQMLVDLLVAVRPALTVMDGVVGMDGNGPRNGAPRPVGAVLASADPVAVDAVACAVVSIDPMDVDTTRLAHRQGVGAGDIAAVEVLGAPLAAFDVPPFVLPTSATRRFLASPLLSFARGYFTAKPVVRDEQCQGCWVCVEHCPPEAMSRDGDQPTIDYDLCVRCYCCQELCPHDAIALRQSRLARVVMGVG